MGTARTYELRLRGHNSPDGEVIVDDVIAIASAVKSLVYRLTRAEADRPGLGRTDAVLEAMSRVRLGLAGGSTRLLFSVGDVQSLPVDPVADGVDEAFWGIAVAIRDDSRPLGVTDTVAEAVDELIAALSRSAPTVDVTVPDKEAVTLRTAHIDRRPWRTPSTQPSSERAVHGLLEMVDLHSARFRIRDSVGNAIDLIDVANPAAAAHLVGERVTVLGVLTVGAGSGHHRMERVVVSPADDIQLRMNGSFASLRESIAVAREHAVLPPMDLSDDELEQFLAVINDV